MIEIPQIEADEWTAGAFIDDGLDKACHEAKYKGETVPGLVYKYQHLSMVSTTHRNAQTEQEIALQEHLLAIATTENYSADEALWAKAALRSLAYIVGYGTDHEGRTFVIQEKVDTEHEEWDFYQHPISRLRDMGGSNWGCRLASVESDYPELVVCDFGMVRNVEELLEVGRAIVAQNPS